MDEIVWLRPQAVAESAFTEWANDAHLDAPVSSAAQRQVSAGCPPRNVRPSISDRRIHVLGIVRHHLTSTGGPAWASHRSPSCSAPPRQRRTKALLTQRRWRSVSAGVYCRAQVARALGQARRAGNQSAWNTSSSGPSVLPERLNVEGAELEGLLGFLKSNTDKPLTASMGQHIEHSRRETCR
jgi:hypothetical protein